MNRDTPAPSADALAMFRDPAEDGSHAEDEDEFEFERSVFTPMSPEEREAQIHAPFAPLSPEELEDFTESPEARPRPPKPMCGARTRKGTRCQCKKLYKSGRCKFHGGLSTGPKTAAGKARAAS